MMEQERLDEVLVDVAGQTVGITRRDRDALLQELCFVAGCASIRREFETAAGRRPVELDTEDAARLSVALEVWMRDGLAPIGMERFHAALVRVVR